MRFQTLLLLLCVAAACLPIAKRSGAATLTVDAGQRFQVLDGLGSNLNVAGWNNGQLKPAIDYLVDYNHASLFRVIRDPITWVQDPSLIPALHALDPATLALVYETPAMQDIWGTIGYLNEKGVRDSQIALNFMGWTPVWMGGSGAHGAVSRIDDGMEDEYATMIASLVYYARRVRNLDFTVLAPLNEMDWDGKEGPKVDVGQYDDVMLAVIAELDHMGLDEIRLAGPDAAGSPDGYVAAILADPVLSGRIDHIGYHKYGSAMNTGPAIPGKTYWMTETAPPCGNCDVNGAPSEGEWEFASKSGELVLQNLANGFSAVLMYEAYDGFYYHHNAYSTWGLLGFGGAAYTPRKRFYINAQINKFLPPNSTRVATEVFGSGFGPVVTFVDSAAQQISIVGRVTSSTSVTLDGSLLRMPFTVPFLRHVRTTSNANLLQASDIPVGGGMFSVVLPPRCFFALTWVGNTAPTASILTPGNGSFFTTEGEIQLAGTGSDTQSEPEELTYQWAVDLVTPEGVTTQWKTFDGPSESYTAPGITGLGAHQRVHLTARDPQGLISDTATVRLWPEIDLDASSLALFPDPPIAGQVAYCTFTVRNRGRMPAPQSRWVITYGGNILRADEAAMSALGRMDMVLPVVFSTAGTHPLRVTLDSLDVLVETDETDNAMTRTITVSPVPGNTAPVAAITSGVLSGPVPLAITLSAANSTDVDGDSLTFDWSFGDGRGAVGRNAAVTFTRGGRYVVRVVAHDGRGLTDTAEVEVNAVDFPRTPVIDDFNRADGILAPPWLDGAQYFTITGGTLAPGSGDLFTEWDGSTFGPNQEAFVTLTTIDTADVEKNLMLKTQGLNWSLGHLQVSYNVQQSKLAFVTFTPPSFWVEVKVVHGITFAPGDRLGARAMADGRVYAYRNDVEIASASVASWTLAATGGRIGLSTSGTTSARFDDFGGGTIDPDIVTPLAVPGAPGSGLRLSAATPNPTRLGARFALTLPAAAEVGFSVVDLAGRTVWSEPARHRGAGAWTLAWDATGAAPGLYFARVRAGAEMLLRRVVVIK